MNHEGVGGKGGGGGGGGEEEEDKAKKYQHIEQKADKKGKAKRRTRLHPYSMQT